MSPARSTEFSRIAPLLVLAVTALILFFARDLLVPLRFRPDAGIFTGPGRQPP